LGAKNCVFLDGADVTREIRTGEVAQAASRLATIARVREVLVAEQQRAGAGGGIVMEGRDIGTVRVPQSAAEDFSGCLAGSARGTPLERAPGKRRTKLRFQKCSTKVIERDKRDRERKVSPLVRRRGRRAGVDNTAMGNRRDRAVDRPARARTRRKNWRSGGWESVRGALSAIFWMFTEMIREARAADGGTNSEAQP